MVVVLQVVVGDGRLDLGIMGVDVVVLSLLLLLLWLGLCLIQ